MEVFVKSKTRYRIKDSVSLFSRKEKEDLYTLEFLFSSSRRVVKFSVNTLTFELIKLCDGSKSLEELILNTSTSSDEVIAALQTLLEEGVLESVMKTSVAENKIYARQINFFAEFERSGVSRYDFHKNIESAQVLILGLGGIGSWVTRSLAQIGVGRLFLIDPDIVSETNISHQGSFSLNDIGKRKASVLKKVVLSLNPRAYVQTLYSQVSKPEQMTPYLENISVAINCADSPDTDTTNDILSRACFTTLTPHILCGGYEGHVSSIGQTVIPGVTSCWRCYVESKTYEKLMRGFVHVPISRAQKDGGTLAPIAAISGNIQALEVLRVLTGYETPYMLNRKGEFDFKKYSLSTNRVPRLKTCSLCGEIDQNQKGEDE